jgi:uncharacterized protein YndB with AHSA1/START domain
VERVDEGQRIVPAPPERVLAALTDAESRAAWLPPSGMTATVEWFDARPGGGYRMVLTYDDPSLPGKSGGHRDVVDVRFVEVDPPNRVVEAVDFVSEDPAFAGTMTMTWTVAPHPQGAMVTVTARDVPSGIDQRDHQAAFADSLAQLEEHLREENRADGDVAGE